MDLIYKHMICDFMYNTHVPMHISYYIIALLSPCITVSKKACLSYKLVYPFLDIWPSQTQTSPKLKNGRLGLGCQVWMYPPKSVQIYPKSPQTC